MSVAASYNIAGSCTGAAVVPSEQLKLSPRLRSSITARLPTALQQGYTSPTPKACASLTTTSTITTARYWAVAYRSKAAQQPSLVTPSPTTETEVIMAVLPQVLAESTQLGAPLWFLAT